MTTYFDLLPSLWVITLFTSVVHAGENLAKKYTHLHISFVVQDHQTRRILFSRNGQFENHWIQGLEVNIDVIY